jgi:hypothetical protein
VVKLSGHSLQAVLVCIWIFPYACLLIWTRNWERWVEKLFASITSAVLFLISFVAFWKLIVSSLPMTATIFFGLVAVIILTALAAVVKKRNWNLAFHLGLVCCIFHVFYFIAIVFLLGLAVSYSS